MPVILLFASGCSGQNDTTKKNLLNRKPAVAGQFYPSKPEELKKMIAGFFEKGVKNKSKNVVAIIAPHAGYVFSGQVAASAFNQIDENKKYKNIFIIGSSHTTSFTGASVYNHGNWETPLGTVEVNMDMGSKLTKECDLIKAFSDVHRFEHSLEVELPFLQCKLKNPFKIVPIILGTQSENDCKKLAEALKPYLKPENLFVVSSDFSHYPAYNDAVKVDSLTAHAIISNSPDQLANTLYTNSKEKIAGLSTSLCGWTSVLTLLYMTTNNPDLAYTKIQYMNSGDIPGYGDKERVVGYVAIAVSSNSGNPSTNVKSDNESFTLTDQDKKDLLTVARRTIEEYIKKGKEPEIDAGKFSSAIKQSCGAFVTLHKKGDLRGCIGRFMATDPLYKVVVQMAVASSTEDYRFSKVTTDELSSIDIEISVLTPLKKIKSIDEFEMGKQGIYIIKSGRSGTFLPQVAKETGWTKEEFLGHCAQDKAGIGWNGWKDAELYTYEAIVFGEKEFKGTSKNSK
ncbi:MAG: AmmeMemoRadiSam system protein B [Bacteroidia bacterium]|nr:AmmeMemoRadiSam system protein B [Bacteroidia bacterium]